MKLKAKRKIRKVYLFSKEDKQKLERNQLYLTHAAKKALKYLKKQNIPCQIRKSPKQDGVEVIRPQHSVIADKCFSFLSNISPYQKELYVKAYKWRLHLLI